MNDCHLSLVLLFSFFQDYEAGFTRLQDYQITVGPLDPWFRLLDDAAAITTMCISQYTELIINYSSCNVLK